MEIKAAIDTLQSRTKTQSIRALITSQDWDPRLCNDVIISEETGNVILAPNAMRPQWYTDATGINARLRKTDFTLTSAKWNERLGSTLAGDYILDCVGDTEGIQTASTLGIANCGMVFSWYVYGDNRQNFSQMVVGYGTLTQPNLVISANPAGPCRLYRGTNPIAEGDLTGKGRKQDDIAGRWFKLVIIPGFRRNGIWIISNFGGSLYHVFEDVDDSTEEPVCVPDTHFFINPAGSSSASIQVAKLKYPNTGWVYSDKVFFADIPTSAQIAAREDRLIVDNRGGSSVLSVKKQDNYLFDYDTPPPSDTLARLRVDLTAKTGNLASPNLYAAQTEYPNIAGLTNDTEEVDVIDNLMDWSISVPESPESVEMTWSLKDPDSISVANIRYGQSRACGMSELLIPSSFFAGVCEEPESNDMYNDVAEHLDLTIRDPWALLDACMYRESKCFDGMLFEDALVDILTDASIPSYLCAIESDGFYVPSIPPSKGQMNWKVDKGEKASSALKRGIEAYAPNWWYGFRPVGTGYEFWAGTPDWYGTTPAETLYFNLSDAKSAHPIDFLDYMYKSFNEKPLPIEANYVKITGLDLHTMMPIECVKQDTSSQDPTVAPSSRPDNWTGFFLPFGIRNDRITTLDVAQRACEAVYNRSTVLYKAAEWESPMIRNSSGNPLWRGDVVYLDNHGVYRIMTVHYTNKKVRKSGSSGTDPFYRINAKYTGLKIGEAP